MAYDGGLAQRIRELLGDMPGVEAKKMFGGVGFMLNGNMACGVNRDDLIIRVGRDRYEEALAHPHSRPFDMTGRPMRGWVVVTPGGYESDADLKDWIEQGIGFARTLPQK
jgi:TfoX/Sxy family transcriptional regulator of competence genes